MPDFIYMVTYVQDGEKIYEAYQRWLPSPQDVIFLPGGTYSVIGRGFDLSNNEPPRYITTSLGNSVDVLVEVRKVVKK